MSKNFTIHLINVWWDETTTDTRFFTSVEEQTEYFNGLVDREGFTATLSNFNINNNVSTTQTVLFGKNENLTDMLATNYAVIREYQDSFLISQRYYFANCSQNSGNLLNVSLNLDDIQTNYFKVKEFIAPCEIRRACLNRFIEVNDTQVTFDNSPTSKMLLNEGATLPKYLQHREFVEMPLFNNQPEIMNNYISAYPITWVYIFIGDTPGVRTELKNWGMGGDIIPFKQISNALSSFFVVAVPLSSKFGIYLNDTNYYFNDLFLRNFLELTNVAGNILDIKFSINAPFTTNATYGEDYKIENNELILTPQPGLPYNSLGFYTLREPVGTNGGTPTYGPYCIMLVGANDRNTKTFTTLLNSNEDFIFDKTTIINSIKDKRFNPKIYSGAFNELNLVDYMGNSYSYDLQKINNNQITLKFDEPITPGQSVGYFRISGNEYYGDNNYCGLVYNNDTRLTYGISQLSSFLANNRNFSQIQQAQRDYTSEVAGLQAIGHTINAIVGASASAGGGIAGSLLTGNPGALIMGGVSAGKQLIQGATNAMITLKTAEAQNELSKVVENATLDNMRNAPLSMKNVQCNVMLPYVTQTQMGLFIERYTATDIDLTRFNDYCTQFGFTYNEIGELKDFDNIRKNFNYISANVGVINYPLSSIEKERLRVKLSGIRFWNSDIINYDNENYERWLEE